MNLRQMFPRATLDPEDVFYLVGPAGCTVEIQQVQYKTLEARRAGEAEIAYFLEVREFKRPIKLNRTSAYAIGEVLGTEETDDWLGRLITIRPTQISIGPNRVWVFDVDLVAPREPSALPPKQDIAGLAADNKRRGLAAGTGGGGASAGTGARLSAPAALAAPIGIDQAASVVAALHERGKTQQDLYEFLKSLGLESGAAGRELPEWPTTTLAAVRTFVKMFPKCAAPMTEPAIAAVKARWQPPAPEVINRRTGEVVTDDDDIPF